MRGSPFPPGPSSSNKGNLVPPEEAYRLEQDATRTGIYTFWVGDEWAIDGWVEENTARYINHCCTPNCGYRVEGRRILIYADRDIAGGERLAQIFQNLLGNALQLLDKPDGRIEVNCYPSPDGHFWTFCVVDNGPRIEQKHFDRIFLPFQTLTHRPGSESTGIGLALVKKIVEMYGGRIWVESTPGQGSTLSFTIPRSRGHDAQQHDPSC